MNGDAIARDHQRVADCYRIARAADCDRWDARRQRRRQFQQNNNGRGEMGE